MTVINLFLSGKYAEVKDDVPDLTNIQTFDNIIIPISLYNGTSNISKYASSITNECKSFLSKTNVLWTQIKGSKNNKFGDFISIIFVADGDKLKCTLKWINVMETINRNKIRTNLFTELKLTLRAQLGFTTTDNNNVINFTIPNTQDKDLEDSKTAEKSLTESYKTEDLFSKKNVVFPIWVIILTVLLFILIFSSIIGLFVFIYIAKRKRTS